MDKVEILKAIKKHNKTVVVGSLFLLGVACVGIFNLGIMSFVIGALFGVLSTVGVAHIADKWNQ